MFDVIARHDMLCFN